MNRDTSINRFPLPTHWLIWAVIVWTLLLGGMVYTHSIREGGAASWDGFERCAWGANLWHDLRHVDFIEFWRHTHEQVVWPFLHSWITGLLFLLFGPTLAAARLFSLFCFAGMAFLNCLWFYRAKSYCLHPKNICEIRIQPYSFNHLAGAITAWILFTCSPMAVQHAAGIMSELPGLFLVFLVVFFFPSREETALQKWVPPAIVLALLFLFKYNYACLTYAGILLSRLFQEKGRIWSLFNKRDATLFGVPLLALFLWFIPNFSAKVEGFIGFALNNPSARMPLSLSSLLFYPTQIPEAYFPHSSIALITLLILAVGAFYSPRICLTNPLVMCFLIHSLAAILHPMKDIRFMFIPMGLYYVMVGEAVAGLINKRNGLTIAKHGKITLAILGILLGITLLSHKETYTQPHLSQNQSFQAPLRFILDHVEPDDRTAFLVSHDWIIPPAISFNLIVNRDMIQRTKDGKKRWDFLYLFFPLATFQQDSKEQWLGDIRSRLFSMNANQIIAVETTAPHKIASFDPLFAGTHAMISLLDSLEEFTLKESREFERIDLRIRIYTLNNH